MDELFAIGEFVMFLLLVYGAGLSAIYWQLGDPTNIEKNRDDREPLRGIEGAETRSTGVGAILFPVGVLLAAGILALPSAALAGEPLENGIRAYHDSKYQDAITHFRVAAEGGDTRAQEILGFMYLQGPSFYGAGVPNDRSLALYWFGRAATGGREVAQHMLCVLSGRPANTVVDRPSCRAGTAAQSNGSRF